LKIATFNINNVRRRLPVLLAWLKQAKPDIVCLQELKTAHEAFPAAAIEDAGFFFVHRGEKTWNGVAILSRAARPVLTRTELRPGAPWEWPGLLTASVTYSVASASRKVGDAGLPLARPSRKSAAWWMKVCS